MSDKKTRQLFSAPCRFVTSVPEGLELPNSPFPEIAFWGRSNCGKSSLLNRLTAQKNLARTSNTPGRTQMLNFFNLADRLSLVDMPGYGFTSAASMRDTFLALNQHYLASRSNLRLVCLLIDARRGIMDIDQQALALLSDTGNATLIVVTKQDSINKQARDMLHDNITKQLATIPNALPELFFTSARKHIGLDGLQKRLALLLK